MEAHVHFNRVRNRSIPVSAPLRLFKVEAGINGLLPTSWAPPTSEVFRQVEEGEEFRFARALI